MLRGLAHLILVIDGWLAGHPHSITVLATVAATLLARFAVHASPTQIAVVASAVVAVIGALAHTSVKAALADLDGKKGA